MRVLLVANTLPPHDLSGAGEQVLQLAWGLRQQGHEVQVLGRRASGLSSRKVLFPLTSALPFLKVLRRFRPHVVQVHESDGGLVALLVAVLAPLLVPRPRLVALLQVSYREEMRAVRPLRQGRFVLGRPLLSEYLFCYLRAPLQVVLGSLSAWLADVVLAPSAATAGEIERDYGVGPVRVLPNATGAPQPVASNRPSTTRGPNPPSRYLLYLGRLRIRKGVEVLLQALAQLRRPAPDLCLVIAGDGERRAALEAMARRLGIRQRTHFLGRCDAARVRSLLRRAQALVVPSVYEGMPLVILEAMEAGVAVVASRVSGIPEVVEDPGTGWLVPPLEPHALARALIQVWENPPEAQRRGAAGRNRVHRHFQPKESAELWGRYVGGGLAREDPEVEE